MKTRISLASLAVAALLAGCGTTSGFAVATASNTDRVKDYQANLLLQSANDLAAINMCYLRASGYTLVSRTGDPVKDAFGEVVKVGEPSTDVGCTVMATALRTQANMGSLFAPFIAKTLESRVPAAPEEIAQSLIEKGLQFSLLKYGIDAVQGVISSGQAATAQVASEGIAAAAKDPLVLTPTVIQVPLGSSAVPLTP